MNYYTAEFSISQKVYHLGTLKESMAENIENVCGEFPVDFVLLGIFQNINDAHDFIEKHKAINPNYSSVEEKLEAAACL